MKELKEIISFLKEYDGEEIRIMEICGSHTGAIAKNGIEAMLSEKIRLIEEAQAEEQAKQLEETEKENKKIETEEAQPLPAEKIESFDMAEADEMTGSDTSGDAKAGLAEAEAAETDAAEAEADGGAAGPKEKERKPLVKRLRK